MEYTLSTDQKQKIRSLTTVPNQKIIVISKENDKPDKGNYAIFYSREMKDAITDLTHKALKLYIALGLNQNGYIFALSPKFICSELNMTEARYKEGINELIEKGYLTQSKEQKNVYVYTTVSQRELTATGIAKRYSRSTENVPTEIVTTDRKLIKNVTTRGTDFVTTRGTDFVTARGNNNEREIIQDNINILYNNNYIGANNPINKSPEEKEYNGVRADKNINNSETVLTVEELLPKKENIKDSNTDLSVLESLPEEEISVFAKDETFNNLIQEDDSKTKARISELEAREAKEYFLPADQDDLLWYLKNKQYAEEQIKKNPAEWGTKIVTIDGKRYKFIAYKETLDCDLPF